MTSPKTNHFLSASDIFDLYNRFDVPIMALDCGMKCAPYNENCVPFCCDTRHAVPTAYHEEWAYLSQNTDLWHLWHAETPEETVRLQAATPPNQVLIECQGYLHCQRNFRSVTCRAFPFFPYVDRLGNFIGLAYYWQYEDRCWVINHLEEVTPAYIQAFVQSYDQLFQAMPQEMDQFRYHSRIMRQVFGRRKQAIPLLHRDGTLVAVNTQTGQLSPINPDDLPKAGPYEVADTLRFPDELDER